MQVQTLGRYRIVKELGRGAMGTVFLAHDPEIDRRIAIKTIQIFASLPDAQRDLARARFLREARSAGKLLHPGIVTVFDVGEADGVPYLAMEYVEGSTLDAFCSKDTLLPVDAVVELCAKAAEALSFAHAAGIVHRDIKPGNLMRVGASDVKIMDFGLAKSAETQLTHDGSLHGTPNYMSPEQIRGLEIDGRSDLFSLAVVLHEMFAGEKPFAGDSISSVLYRIVHEKPTVLAVRPEHFPETFAVFLERALAKDPGSRFANGTEFAGALRRAHETGKQSLAEARAHPAGEAKPAGPPPARPRATIPPPPPRPSAPRRWPYVLGAVVVAGVAVAVFALGKLGGGAKPVVAVPTSLEVRVRTDPPGLGVALDGKPIAGDRISFSSVPPFGTLTATVACRTASHTLDPADGGREIVLVPDPVTTALVIDPAVPGARIRWNGREMGAAPRSLDVDLCQESRIEVVAPGYRTTSVVVPRGATPLEARTAAGGLSLAAIPRGKLVLPAARAEVRWYVDGKEVRPGATEVPEGSHEIRAVSEDQWIDVRAKVDVHGGEEARPQLSIPALATLVIQAFPANCKAYLKKGGAEWRFLDDTPVERQIAAGSYSVKVEFTPTGETREQDVKLSPGANPPLRFAFARPRR